jgi:hypothetical protein
MAGRKLTAWAVVICIVTPALLLARQNIVKNGSMESGQGPGAPDPMVPAEWSEFGLNVERSSTVNLVPPGAGHALKAFGDNDSNSAGASQIVAGVSPGQAVTASIQLYSPGDDKLGGTGSAGLVLSFLNQFNGNIETYQVYVLDANSPADTWIPAVLGPFVAPPNTAKVRVSCRLEWTPGNVSGAAYWDDAQLSIDGGANELLNGDFETAGVGAGQSPTGIDEWMGFNDQEKSQDVALHGLSSLLLGTREAYSGLYQDMVALNDGDHIYMQAWVYNPSADPLTANSRVGVKLEFEPNVEVPPPEENLAFDENTPADQWTLIELSTTVPQEATEARVVMIWAADSQTTGEVHFDSAYAERGSFPGVNQLQNTNWSFEFGSGGPNGIADWTEFNSPGVSQCQKSCFEVTAHHGSCTAKGTGPAVAGIFQELPVTPGESFYISAYLYTPGFAPLTGSGTAGVKVEWAVGEVPPDVDIGGATNTIDAGAATDTWIPIYIDYVMPPGSSALTRFTNLIEKGAAFSGTVYFDACQAVVLNKFDGSDVDGDDDQDLHDVAWLQLTFTGAGAGGLPYNGIVFDHDDDLDVDSADFNYFAPRTTGPQ